MSVREPPTAVADDACGATVGAALLTVVEAVASLFAGEGSSWPAATDAVFEITPAAVAVTTTDAVAVAPEATIPSVHVTVPTRCEHVPCDGVALTTVTPAGSGSLRDTLVAGSGPALLTTSE